MHLEILRKIWKNNIAIKKSLAIGERKHKKEVLENCNIKIISTRRGMDICIVRYFESRGD